MRFSCTEPALARELCARGWRPTDGAAVDLHARRTPPPYPEWRVTPAWVLHVPGIGDVLDGRRRRALLARLPALRGRTPFVAPLLVAPGDPVRAWTTEGPRATLATVAAAVRLAAVAEAGRAGLSLARCATLLEVAFDGDRLSVARAHDAPRTIAALETLGILRRRRGPSFQPLLVDARRLLVPRRAELVALRARGEPSWQRFSPRAARGRVVDGRLHVVARGEAFELDDVAGYVFLRVVEDGATVDAVVDELHRRFVVSRRRIEGDVHDLLAAWAARGWVGGKMAAP